MKLFIDIDLPLAIAYVKSFTLDNEDFLDAEDEKKLAFLNVASQTLTRKYKEVVIPNEAVFFYATYLGAAYNDTNKMNRQGVASFAFRGFSYTFKKSAFDDIPDEVIDLINDENGTDLRAGNTPQWTVI